MSARQDYQAALEGAAFYLHMDGGWLSLAGPDRIDFLHRQSTGDLRTLSPDQAVITVLTSPTARILDVLWVLPDSEKLIVLTLPGRSERTSAFLKGKIFFMDKVTVIDESSHYDRIDLIGPQAGEVFGALSISPPSGVGGMVSVEVLGLPVKVLGLDRWLQHAAYRLCVPSAGLGSLVEFLKGRGVVEIGHETWSLLRIEAGMHGEGELTEKYTPLEVGLDYAVSDSKGCYTGQEVLARQVTYDKVVRCLVGVRLSNRVEAGTEVLIEGRSIGALTSVGQSPRFGHIGLAVIRRSYAEVGSALATKDAKNAIGVIAALPFGK